MFMTRHECAKDKAATLREQPKDTKEENQSYHRHVQVAVEGGGSLLKIHHTSQPRRCIEKKTGEKERELTENSSSGEVLRHQKLKACRCK
mmetsp:Transcript_34810/g.51604  ORF Transcript_34810/g.51604 Transcript_34810/m.51604 type:complete len:90 (-) Transcript_34810:999-1268(-)